MFCARRGRGASRFKISRLAGDEVNPSAAKSLPVVLSQANAEQQEPPLKKSVNLMEENS